MLIGDPIHRHVQPDDEPDLGQFSPFVAGHTHTDADAVHPCPRMLFFRPNGQFLPVRCGWWLAHARVVAHPDLTAYKSTNQQKQTNNQKQTTNQTNKQTTGPSRPSPQAVINGRGHSRHAKHRLYYDTVEEVVHSMHRTLRLSGLQIPVESGRKTNLHSDFLDLDMARDRKKRNPVNLRPKEEL